MFLCGYVRISGLLSMIFVKKNHICDTGEITLLLICSMYLEIALVLSVIFQFGAFFITISLIRKTRFNISWILISLAFFLMAVRRLLELIDFKTGPNFAYSDYVGSWIAVLISVTVFIASFFIRKIFIYQKKIDEIKSENEKKIVNAVIEAQEKERKTLARELHDGLGPVLSSIKMALSAISFDKGNKFNNDILHKVDNSTDRAIASVKEITNNISPALLERYGLTKAVNSFIAGLVENKIFFQVESQVGSKRFSYQVEIVIYRVICELISNTIRHSGASNADLNISLFDNIIEVFYVDDGIGFDLKISEGKGMGILNIISRIKSVEGTIEFKSPSSGGIIVKIKIPCNE